MIDIQNEFTTVIMELSFGESVTCDKSLTNIFRSVIATVKLRNGPNQDIILTSVSLKYLLPVSESLVATKPVDDKR